MQRRTFNKLAAGIMSLGVLPETEPEIDLGAFVDYWGESYNAANYRYDLASPFEQLGSTIATDGRVAILLDRVGLEKTGHDRRLPDFGKVVDSCWSDCNWRAWPGSNYFDSGDTGGCVHCKAEGFVRPWRFCDNDECEWGEVICERDFVWKKCPRCDGKGKLGVPCGVCNGEPYQDDFPDGQIVGNRLIAPIYHKLVSTLPGVEYSATGARDQCVAFRFDGGRGFLMPRVQ